MKFSRIVSFAAAAVLLTPAFALDKTQVTAVANHAESKAAGGWGDYPASLAIDGEVSGKSSWRGEKQPGAEGEPEQPPTITFTFPKKVELDGVTIVFFKHFDRVYTIDILGATSDNGKFKMLAKGVKNPGEGENQTVFEFKKTKLKQLRIVGHGNSNEKFADWTNIIEIYFNEPA
ncbi:discoidin domain-containing protein [Cerasicoccus maritimus]|uniref:discoidin domain-containing protein n=1 Tax=Cerasicoccus maritimus TaxID=490089 RepID=UPI00285256AA|nr:discoidin domain-containing protein [Cerasicoccus maritimus]